MLLLRTLQLCLTPSSMVCPLISIFRVYHCEWACFGQTNVENKCLIHHHSGTHHCLQFRRLTWMTTPTTRTSSIIVHFTFLFHHLVYLNGSLLKGWNSRVFLSSPSMVSAMLHAFLNTWSPVFNSLFCIFRLFGPHWKLKLWALSNLFGL